MGCCLIPHETIKVAVLDFDGTLIDSNRLKYEAFFKLFLDGTTQNIVRAVLDEMFEASRYEILAEILARRDHCRPKNFQSEVRSLATVFNNIVVVEAKHCREIEGAAEALVFLSSRVRLYVSSTTPEDALKEIIDYRGWSDYFVEVFGYPRKKSETLARIIDQEKVESSRVMVIGDGESDRISARENRCKFIPVDEVFPLSEVVILLGE
ncbi:MAG: HAD family hydrolase [Deltaproteobacteria bacterium]|nr:HAD family hydrolase [Deltaproteobacteria bacterium]